MTLSEELEARGFIHQFAGESVTEIVDGPKRTIYHGIDPTADSAHAGNFVAWLLLRHLALKGHKIIFLVGGGTGMIGDPKSDVERTLLDEETIAKNVTALKKQAHQIFGDIEVEFVNNAEWLTQIKLIEFLRDIGKHFTVNELVKKEAISKRLEREDGISYTEFAYPLLQGYDYLELHRRYGCNVQVGGSDQWGNIIAGVELIRRKEQQKVFALTTPLVIDKTTGKKFGKSEGNAVWLDPEKTSPYAFYQFWLNVADENVIDYLKIFSFLSLEDIEAIKIEFEKNPGGRNAQKVLASEVTKLVHGQEQTHSIEKVTDIIFGGGDASILTAEEQNILLENAPVYEIQGETNIVDLIVHSGLATSKREARTFIESGAITFSSEKVESIEHPVGLLSGDLFTLRRGKKQYVVIYKK